MPGPSPDILQTASQATPWCGAFFPVEKRYLILAEGKSADPHYGKTARGVLRFSPHPTVAILDTERAGETENGIPVVGSVNDALCFNPTTALVGVATQGGRFPPAWRELLRSCVAKGLDVENGLHEFLGDDAELVELAARHGVELRDLRKPPADLNVPTGENLELDAQVVLTVGSDCAIGKMTVSVELDREARERGLRSVFIPTGQTGIAIAGWGISVDAVVSDFLAGAAERLVVEGAGKGELLLVEGQGALLHPAYSGVTLGLMHGSAPHAYVLCHQAGSTAIEGYPEHPLPPLRELVELHERASLTARPARVACIALNTRALSEDDARAAVAEAERETGLPADDPVRFGAAKLLDAVVASVGLSTGPSEAGYGDRLRNGVAKAEG
jgi:D-glutamate N-acetyltransferase